MIFRVMNENEVCHQQFVVALLYLIRDKKFSKKYIKMIKHSIVRSPMNRIIIVTFDFYTDNLIDARLHNSHVILSVSNYYYFLFILNNMRDSK